MRFLLDTHAWLWSVAAPERLSSAARALLEDERNELVVSIASFWEVAIKHSIGKLVLPEPPGTYLPKLRDAADVEVLGIDLRHVIEVAGLEWLHRDPFDRMLVAQARVEHLTVMTADAQLAAYGIEVMACRGPPRSR